MTARPAHDRTEIPAGHHVVAVPESPDHWRVAAGKPCRYARQGRIRCGQPSAAEVLRGTKRIQWWAYCPAHMYGRWVEDGRVMNWILRKKEDGNG